jgi:hypothetical protein
LLDRRVWRGLVSGSSTPPDHRLLIVVAVARRARPSGRVERRICNDRSCGH